MALSLIPGEKLIAATHNPGKAVEISALLGGRFEVVTAASLNLPNRRKPRSALSAMRC